MTAKMNFLASRRTRSIAGVSPALPFFCSPPLFLAHRAKNWGP